jgi:hypothetical protein
MKRTLALVLGVLIIAVYGYYGEFKRVSNALAHVKGVTILVSGYNADISLEEFAFDLRLADGRTNHLYFSETNPIRKMSGQQLDRALEAEVQKLSSQKAE